MENKVLLKKLEERLERKINYKRGDNTIQFHNQDLKEYDEWGNLLLNGFIISLQEVYRHNGTEENKSCRLTINYWKNNVGKYINDWKISSKASDKKIDKIVDEVVEEYKKLN